MRYRSSFKATGLQSDGVSFGDGIRCAGGNLIRLYAKTAMQGSVSAPEASDLSISAQSAVRGDMLTPGLTRYYQVYYRDSDPSFCPTPQGDAWNVTNGVRVVW